MFLLLNILRASHKDQKVLVILQQSDLLTRFVTAAGRDI
jgi:hypothetical protein